ncbi:hypothetical protein C2845_PM11G10520 [Panicum miliaceum]|uniref:DUF295 domain-containing protein n=1 Tax=Panicum miliaceum TaxID=4540 RepID=A0A3L6RUJ1_PANMI|nr:hypothetical protein C2845_PM11G10520 [Panicum miliaceum]
MVHPPARPHLRVSDLLFAVAHAVRHPDPLLLAWLAKFRNDVDKARVSIIGLSGSVVKRVAGLDGHELLCTRLNLAYLATDWNRCSFLDPATGAVHVLPGRPAEEHANCVNWKSDPYTFFALGRVTSAGEHKVLRMFNELGFHNGGQQIFEVSPSMAVPAMHGGEEGKGSGIFIDDCSGVVVDGVVYFLTRRVADLSCRSTLEERSGVEVSEVR